jgi:hypothetical protein
MRVEHCNRLLSPRNSLDFRWQMYAAFRHRSSSALGRIGLLLARPRSRNRRRRDRGFQRVRYAADPRTIEEIVAVMRAAGDNAHGRRLRALIVVLWRAGLRIHEALALAEIGPGSAPRFGACSWGKGGGLREVGVPLIAFNANWATAASASRPSTGKASATPRSSMPSLPDASSPRAGPRGSTSCVRGFPLMTPCAGSRSVLVMPQPARHRHATGNRIITPSGVVWNAVVPALGFALLLGASLLPAIAIAGAASIAITAVLVPESPRGQGRRWMSTHVTPQRVLRGHQR